MTSNKLLLLSRVSLKCLLKRINSGSLGTFLQVWMSLEEYVLECSSDEQSKKVLDDIGQTKFFKIFEDTANSVLEVASDISDEVTAHLLLCFDVIVCLCEYTESLIDCSVITSLARYCGPILHGLIRSISVATSVRCRITECILSVIEAVSSHFGKTQNELQILNFFMAEQNIQTLAAQLSGCGMYFLQGSMMEIIVTLMHILIQREGATAMRKFASIVCHGLTQSSKLVLMLKDMLIDLVDTKDEQFEEPLTERIRGFLNQYNIALQKTEQSTVFSYLAKKVLVNNEDRGLKTDGSQIWVDFGKHSFEVMLPPMTFNHNKTTTTMINDNHEKNYQANSNEAVLLSCHYKHIIESKVNSPTVRFKTSIVSDLMASDAESWSKSFCGGKQIQSEREHIVIFELSRSECSALFALLQQKGIPTKLSRRRTRECNSNMAHQQQRVPSSKNLSSFLAHTPTKKVKTSTKLNSDAAHSRRKQSIVDSYSISLLNMLMEPIKSNTDTNAAVSMSRQKAKPSHLPSQLKHNIPICKSSGIEELKKNSDITNKKELKTILQSKSSPKSKSKPVTVRSGGGTTAAPCIVPSKTHAASIQITQAESVEPIDVGQDKTQTQTLIKETQGENVNVYKDMMQKLVEKNFEAFGVAQQQLITNLVADLINDVSAFYARLAPKSEQNQLSSSSVSEHTYPTSHSSRLPQ